MIVFSPPYFSLSLPIYHYPPLSLSISPSLPLLSLGVVLVNTISNVFQ